MIDCTLVTCERVPKLDPDDQLFAEELVNRGWNVATEVWSDPTVDWSNSRICVLRSTWDYHKHIEEFIEWLDRVSSVTVLWNPPELLRWSADKGYLRDLEAAGVRTVPTVWAKRGESFNLYKCSMHYRFLDIVIKPARGAATHDVLLFHADHESLAHGQAHLDRLLESHDALIQPYLESVTTYGERALVFIQGRYSHAVIKKPFDRLLAVRGSSTPAVEVTPAEIELAKKALSVAPVLPKYGRVDLLCDSEGAPCVNEVELIEPGLYFGAHPRSAIMFADALEHELDAMPLKAHVENPRLNSAFSEVS
jgi:glutathione synthase/RimK-type ligase-like ATP-grasp enzyme